MDIGSTYLLLAGIVGFTMAFGVGANDAANAIGTAVGAKAITLRNAIIIAAIFESLGAILAGGEVTNTIRNQIIQPSNTSQLQMIYGMLSASLSAGAWLLIASKKGWPVSTTHSLIGAIIGFGVVAIGIDAIYWHRVVDIAMSWVVAPIIAGVVAYAIFLSIQKNILNKPNPLSQARNFLPMYVSVAAFVLGYFTLTKSLKHLGLSLSGLGVFFSAALFAGVIFLLAFFLLHRIDKPRYNLYLEHALVEKYFGVLMIFTACAMAFAHGSNDVANAIGPLAAIADAVNNQAQPNVLPWWIIIIGISGIVAGLVTYGYKIIATIGKNITDLTPSRGFAAEISAASTVLMASMVGLPVSTTQTLVGAILGVGLAKGITAINLKVVRQIFFSWFITLPVGAIICIVCYYLMYFTIEYCLLA